MLGAIVGDIIGSSYEFRPYKGKDFPLFTELSRFTDDTVMTLAVAQAFLDVFGGELGGGRDNRDNRDNRANRENCEDGGDRENKACRVDRARRADCLKEIRQALVRRMQEFGRRYPEAGYGGGFSRWLQDPEAKPYQSFGNGSAMRVSSVAWLFEDLTQVRAAARQSAVVSHNHPEGLKGAEAVASCIFLARQQASKDYIKAYVEKNFAYDLDRSLAEIRPDYSFDVTCQGSVPQAIRAFWEGRDFEDCIRNAVSLGGDADTQAAMAGSIAEAYYGVPKLLADQTMAYLPAELREVLESWWAWLAC